MNLQHLIYALEVYKSGSISKAAQNLYMAQPNLSTAIRELEREIGTTIFRRTPRGIEPTQNGERFIRYANDIVERFNGLENMYRTGERPLSTLSVITTRSSEISICTAEFIDELGARGTPFRVKLREGTNFDVINDVVNGDADIGILRPNSADASYYYQMAAYKDLALIKMPLASYVVLFSKDHPLADAPYLTADMLKPFIEVVHGDYATPLYPLSKYDYYARPDADDGKRVVFVCDRGTLMDMLSNVRGSYIWTSTTHQQLKERFGLVEKRCDAPAVHGQDALIYDKNRPFTPEMQSYMELLKTKVYAYDGAKR